MAGGGGTLARWRDYYFTAISVHPAVTPLTVSEPTSTAPAPPDVAVSRDLLKRFLRLVRHARNLHELGPHKFRATATELDLDAERTIPEYLALWSEIR